MISIDLSFFKELFWFIFIFTVSILVIVLPIILFSEWIISLFRRPLFKRQLQQKGQRYGIPKEVKREDWRRDEGR